MLNANLIAQEQNRREAISTLQRLRREARDEISRLIQFLDQSDPYVMTELEDGADDGPCDTDELEVSEGDDEDGGDNEPALGSLDHHHSQERWAVGDRRDLELDPAQSGIGDLDGLLEQIGTQDWQRGGMT